MKVILLKPVKEMTTTASVGLGPEMMLGSKSSAIAANRREYGKKCKKRKRRFRGV